MNPKAYCTEHGISTKEFITKANPVAPKYNKQAHCMASNPAYGLTLAPELARHMGGKTENRARPCKYTFRLLERDRAEFNAAKEAYGHTTDQQAVEYAIKEYIKNAAIAHADDNRKPKILRLL